MERLCYYGVRSIFVLFLVQRLLLPKPEASAVYATLMGLGYLLPVAGAWLADCCWGPARTVRTGSVLLVLGTALVAVSAQLPVAASVTQPCLLVGLGLLAAAGGFFKPAYYAAVGFLTRRQRSWELPLFFWVMLLVNVGAFLAPLLIGTIGDTGNPEDFRWGFLLAAVVAVSVAAIAWGLRDTDLMAAPAELVRQPGRWIWVAAAITIAALLIMLYHPEVTEAWITLLQVMGAVILLLPILLHFQTTGLTGAGRFVLLLTLALAGLTLNFTGSQSIMLAVFGNDFMNPIGLIFLAFCSIAGVWFLAQLPAAVAKEPVGRFLLWAGISLLLGLASGGALVHGSATAAGLGIPVKAVGLLCLLLLSFFETGWNVMVPAVLARTLPAHLLARALTLFFLLFTLAFKAATFIFGT